MAQTRSAGTRPTSAVTAWAQAVVAAVDRDNRLNPLCGASETAALLRRAPGEVEEQARLALLDFTACADRPLHELRSDAVAHRFRVDGRPHSVNALVGRMNVPSGPWPGHYGLEAVLFSARAADMPSWFPPATGSAELHFADIVASSGGFRRGQGSVVFPELLATTQKVEQQNFGLVFIDKLVRLYRQAVLPALDRTGLAGSMHSRHDQGGLTQLREWAFLAHEWGHIESASPFALGARPAHRRLASVLGELEADLAALVMLVGCRHESRLRTATVLLLDRVLREASLPRLSAQVNGIAARQLAVVLRRHQVLVPRDGGVLLDLESSTRKLAAELSEVRDLVGDLVGGESTRARNYLRGDGWQLRDGRYFLALDDPVLARLMPGRSRSR